jgi:hypothetical protein
MLRAVKLVSSTPYGAVKYYELNREQLGIQRPDQTRHEVSLCLLGNSDLG